MTASNSPKTKNDYFNHEGKLPVPSALLFAPTATRATTAHLNNAPFALDPPSVKINFNQ